VRAAATITTSCILHPPVSIQDTLSRVRCNWMQMPQKRLNESVMLPEWNQRVAL